MALKMKHFKTDFKQDIDKACNLCNFLTQILLKVKGLVRSKNNQAFEWLLFVVTLEKKAALQATINW